MRQQMPALLHYIQEENVFKKISAINESQEKKISTHGIFANTRKKIRQKSAQKITIYFLVDKKNIRFDFDDELKIGEA